MNPQGVYVIRRQVNGQRFEISTRARSRRAAIAHLERFEADPYRYDPAGFETRRGALWLSGALSFAFLQWSRDKGNTKPWVRKQQTILAWWADRLRRVDLRRASLQDHIKPHCTGPGPARHHRVAVLKTFFAWLREEKGLVTQGEDPTLPLPVPQLVPAQWRKTKAVTEKDFNRARKHMDGLTRFRIDVLAATGWHVTELIRFAAGGEVRPYKGTGKGVAAVLLCPRTKGGEPVLTPVSRRGKMAAMRVRGAGSFSREWFDRAVADACKAAKVKFTGAQMRHTVATLADEAGDDPVKVSRFLNHKSATTTKRFYSVWSVPPKVRTLV